MLIRNQNAVVLSNHGSASLLDGVIRAARQTRLWRGKGLFLALALFANPALSGVCHAQEWDDDDDGQVEFVDGYSGDDQMQYQDLSSDDPYAYLIDQGTEVDDAAPIGDQDYIDAGSPSLSLNFEVQLADGRRYAFTDLQKAKNYAKQLQSNRAWGQARLIAKKGYLYARSDGQSFVIGKFNNVKSYHKTISKTPGFSGSIGTTRYNLTAKPSMTAKSNLTIKPNVTPRTGGPVSSGNHPSVARTVTPSLGHTSPRTIVPPQTHVNPSVVHSTPTVKPSYTAPSVRTPSYTTPTVRTPSYSAPSYRAPSYSAPSFRAPSYSAPAVRSFSSPSVRGFGRY